MNESKCFILYIKQFLKLNIRIHALLNDYIVEMQQKVNNHTIHDTAKKRQINKKLHNR